jgi:hypothetical protein
VHSGQTDPDEVFYKIKAIKSMFLLRNINGASHLSQFASRYVTGLLASRGPRENGIFTRQ